MTDSELIDRAQDLARGLSYNEPTQAPAKHTIRELCHRLGARGVVIRKHTGLRLWAITMYGQHEPLTLRENILWRLFDVVPSRFYDREAGGRN